MQSKIQHFMHTKQTGCQDLGLVFLVTPAIFILDQVVRNILRELFVEFRLCEILNCRQNETKKYSNKESCININTFL